MVSPKLYAVLLAAVSTACASAASSPHYAIVSERIAVLRDGRDFEHVSQVQKTAGDEFVWFVRDGAEYVVTDPGFIREMKWREGGATLAERYAIDASPEFVPGLNAIWGLDYAFRDIPREPLTYEDAKRYGGGQVLTGAGGHAYSVRRLDYAMDDLFTRALRAGIAH